MIGAILEQHGGRVEARNVPDGGAEVAGALQRGVRQRLQRQVAEVVVLELQLVVAEVQRALVQPGLEISARRVLRDEKRDQGVGLCGARDQAMVLDVLWDDDGWMVPGEVHAVIGRHRRLAYTTIMTTMVRLWEKDRLDRRRRTAGG